MTDNGSAPTMILEETERELLLEIRRDVRDIKNDMEKVKKTLFGTEDRLGLVARVMALEKDLTTLVGALKWLAVVVAAAIFGLMWAIFTGQVQLVFK